MNSKFPEITTARFLLRQFTAADQGNVFKGLSHPEVIKYYGVSYATFENAAAQMEFFRDLEKNGTGCWWAIVNKQSGEFVGGSGLNNISKEHRKGEIGFWLLPEFQGKGIIKEVVPAILQYAFRDLALHRVEGMVEAGNVASSGVLQKLGFRHEGTMKDCEIKNGKFISLEIYALLEGE